MASSEFVSILSFTAYMRLQHYENANITILLEIPTSTALLWSILIFACNCCHVGIEKHRTPLDGSEQVRKESEILCY